jgi:hypothetical protein
MRSRAVVGGRLLPFQAAPLYPEQRDVQLRLGKLLLEEQIRLRDDPEHAAVVVRPPGAIKSPDPSDS